jgi:hypothetical protein
LKDLLINPILFSKIQKFFQNDVKNEIPD